MKKLLFSIGILLALSSFSQSSYKPKVGDVKTTNEWKTLWTNDVRKDNLLFWKYYKKNYQDSVPKALISLKKNDTGVFVVYCEISKGSVLEIKDFRKLSVEETSCIENVSYIIYPKNISSRYYYTDWYDNDFSEMYYKKNGKYVDHFIYEIRIMKLNEDDKPQLVHRELWAIDDKNKQLIEVEKDKYKLEIIDPEDEGL